MHRAVIHYRPVRDMHVFMYVVTGLRNMFTSFSHFVTLFYGCFTIPRYVTARKGGGVRDTFFNKGSYVNPLLHMGKTMFLCIGITDDHSPEKHGRLTLRTVKA